MLGLWLNITTHNCHLLAGFNESKEEHFSFKTAKTGVECESLEQIFILRQESLIITLISRLVVWSDMRTCYDLFHFLEYLAPFTHDGVEVLLELFYEWGIIVTNLLYDEGTDVPCVIVGDSGV